MTIYIQIILLGRTLHPDNSSGRLSIRSIISGRDALSGELFREGRSIRRILSGRALYPENSFGKGALSGEFFREECSIRRIYRECAHISSKM